MSEVGSRSGSTRSACLVKRTRPSRKGGIVSCTTSTVRTSASASKSKSFCGPKQEASQHCWTWLTSVLLSSDTARSPNHTVALCDAGVGAPPMLVQDEEDLMQTHLTGTDDARGEQPVLLPRIDVLLHLACPLGLQQWKMVLVPGVLLAQAVVVRPIKRTCISRCQRPAATADLRKGHGAAITAREPLLHLSSPLVEQLLITHEGVVRLINATTFLLSAVDRVRSMTCAYDCFAVQCVTESRQCSHHASGTSDRLGASHDLLQSIRLAALVCVKRCSTAASPVIPIPIQLLFVGLPLGVQQAVRLAAQLG